MLSSKRVLSILLITIMVAGSLLVVIQSDGATAEAAPARAGLYKHSESFNVTFSKPTFYGDKDPNNNNKYVGNNTWDDIAFMIYFQDQHTSTTTVSGNTVTTANIYQSVFVELDNETVITGTDETILMEDFTATWCPYCTSIIGTMERLDHDEDWFPEKYIGVEFHTSGTYGNTLGGTRKNYYCSSSGIPTWIIDGVDATIGGGTSPNNTATDTAIKNKINNRISTSAFNITARAGHTDTQAWVDFSFTIEDQTYDNILVDCNVLLVQEAFPRRHGYDPNCYLGWIGQDMKSPAIFQNVQGSAPVISGITPGDGSLVSGTVGIGFNATDADAADSKITTTVEVKGVDDVDWAKLAKSGGVYTWNTAAKSGDNYIYPDGDYEIRITAVDYWNEIGTETIQVSILNPDEPTVSLDATFMQDQLEDGVLEGNFDIKWTAEDDEDGNVLLVDLYYMRPGMEWTPIAEGLDNLGVYSWNTFEPRVPDNDRYRVMARVTDSDEMSAEIAGAFEFEINNPDPPTLEIHTPYEGQELSGEPTIRWTAEDNEDTQSHLTIDIWISDDGGVNYSPLASGKPNTQSYKFDSNYYPDGTEYRLKIRVTDSTERYMEAESDIFAIYNNDIPECDLVEPREDDMVSGSFEIEWYSSDQEDAPGDLTFDLYYMFSGGTYWKELAIGEPNTGSFELDTLDLEEGDGVYTIRLVVKDSRGEISDPRNVYFTVYNPDEPEIITASGPTSMVSRVASFTWYAEDPDPFETDWLKVWFLRSTDGVNWETVVDGMANTGTLSMDIQDWEDGTYKIKMVVADCQPGEYNMTTEYAFSDLIVDNNDPPTVEFVDSPDGSVEHNGTLTFSWTASDPEDNRLLYSVYYRIVGTETWSTVPGAVRISTTAFTWDLSYLEDGDYELRIVAMEDTKDSLEAEVLSTTFKVKQPEAVVDDDDDDDVLPPVQDTNDGETSVGLIIAVVAAVAVLLVIILVGAALVIMNRKKAQTQLPPPGGLPMQPAQPGLPGQVGGGELAPRSQLELPPFQPMAPAQPELPPTQPQVPAQQPPESPF